MASTGKLWGSKIVTLELDPIVAVIARNIIELAGVSDSVTVYVGHSEEALSALHQQLSTEAFQMVFMDHCGGRFHLDLPYLQNKGMLDSPCVIVADNVLQPGAPLYL
eukprot:gnl/MRDRNA2_/MRDRNA2_260230_c0_seq1.p1 gnl/MRDRNA2_/MRDRNA2_260230_c0~~gnl/MRDRNA2_/MRDRNA2_260230_c0_seq1.p1  ORF type:complete len:107 (-),score=21.92 gnl/MRDRNA2_/MRDRNA2_260230_c0_seq1:126-446(-)